jgi:TrkA-N domain./TrkA-C domain.
MKIIIIGDGKVGYSLAETLSQDKNDVTIIDKNDEALKKASENLDVMCIRGSGVSASVMIEAGVKDADLVIAATSSDELNMVSCLAAKKLGAAHTVARIRDPEYTNELSMLKHELGLDAVINPEQAAAREIARLLRFPSAVNVETFARGRVELVEIMADEETPVVGMKIKNISRTFSSNILIGAVLRGEELVIPNGEFEIQEGDTLYIIGSPESVFDFCRLIGKCKQEIKNIMVIGGSRVAYYLVQDIKKTNMKVKIIESSRERCMELSELLPGTLIINGDGSDEDLLLSENLHEMDALVTLTGRDEENLMIAFSGKQHGVGKVIAKVTKTNYPNVIKKMGIDNIINPKRITADYIVRYVRGMKNAFGTPIETLYRIIGGKAEVIEFIAGPSTRFLNVPLRKLKMVENTLVAAIVRKGQIIIPHGNDSITKDDNVIIVTMNSGLTDLNEILASGGLSE